MFCALQDSDSDEEASDSGACRAKVAPAPRRPPPAKAAGGSDDESAAGPKPGDKVGVCAAAVVACRVARVSCGCTRLPVQSCLARRKQGEHLLQRR